MRAPEAVFEPGSFRDPQARVFYQDSRVYRAVAAEALEHWSAVSRAPFMERALAEGRVVDTWLEPEPFGGWAGVLQHRCVPFVSYPYEWTFSMLREAALLTLGLLREALDDGFTLKDASAYNVQWFGARPTVVDVTSFTAHEEGTPWVGYRQFCEMFLFPLLLQARRGIAFQPWLRGRLEGITPAECARLLSWWDLLRTGAVADVALQAHLDRAATGTRSEVMATLKQAGLDRRAVRANADRLARMVEALHWEPEETAWSGYSGQPPYTAEARERKREFVRRAVGRRRWSLAWDLGANDGEYSRLAAEQSDFVVAMDSDAPSVDRLFQDLHARGEERILPLVVDLADPSPAQGWRGAERKSLAQRGRPDLVLGLALVHHLALGRHLPLQGLLQELAGLGSSVVLEWVTPADPQARALLDGLTAPRPDYSTEAFEAALEDLFEVRSREVLPGGTRIMFHADSRQR